MKKHSEIQSDSSLAHSVCPLIAKTHTFRSPPSDLDAIKWSGCKGATGMAKARMEPFYLRNDFLVMMMNDFTTVRIMCVYSHCTLRFCVFLVMDADGGTCVFVFEGEVCR